MVVEGGEPLLARRLHDRPPAALQRFLEERRQHGLERLPLQMIEEDLGHPRSIRRVAAMRGQRSEPNLSCS